MDKKVLLAVTVLSALALMLASIAISAVSYSTGEFYCRSPVKGPHGHGNSGHTRPHNDGNGVGDCLDSGGVLFKGKSKGGGPTVEPLGDDAGGGILWKKGKQVKPLGDEVGPGIM